jgi:hypothetical protein
MGKARDHPHRGLTLEQPIRGDPLVVLDYGNFDTDDTTGKTVEDPEAPDRLATTLIMCDDDSGYPYAVSTPTKAVSPYLTTCATKFITLLRHEGIRLRTDNEPAIVKLAEQVAKAREPKTTMLEQTPLYSSASNGRAERTIQTVRRQSVTMKLDLQSR